MYFGVCVLIMNENGQLLSVSRKNDPTDIGLPGGKIEPGETPLEACLRELFEETGYKIIDARYAQLVYCAESEGKLAVTYQIPFAAIKQVERPKENGVVAWVEPGVLADGKTFGEYNTGLFKTLGISIGIRRSYSITSKWDSIDPGYDYLHKAKAVAK